MFNNVKYTIPFRLGAYVELTEEEIIKVTSGDSSPIIEKINNKSIRFGYDSYIPGIWINELDNVPEAVKRHFKKNECYEDIDLDIEGVKL